MMNLFYRGYVIHEDIRAISYTVFDRRPDRLELGSSGTAKEAMQWVDRHLKRRVTASWIDRDTAQEKAVARGRPSQAALL